jgi:hypothetical protein
MYFLFFPSFTDQHSHKNFFNMKGLALFSAALSTIKKGKDVVYFYRKLAYKCLELSNKRYFEKLEYLTNEFHYLYHSLKKIRAVKFINFSHKMMKNIKKYYIKEFLKIDLMKSFKEFHQKIYNKLKNLDNLKRKLKMRKLNNVEEKMKKFLFLLKNIVFTAFRLFYSGLRRCEVVPKCLRKYSRNLLKNKGRKLLKIVKNNHHLYEKMYQLSSVFKLLRITGKNTIIIRKLKLIAKFFLKLYKKN